MITVIIQREPRRKLITRLYIHHVYHYAHALVAAKGEIAIYQLFVIYV